MWPTEHLRLLEYECLATRGRLGVHALTVRETLSSSQGRYDLKYRTDIHHLSALSDPLVADLCKT
jgi:hypothetical protein